MRDVSIVTPWSVSRGPKQPEKASGSFGAMEVLLVLGHKPDRRKENNYVTLCQNINSAGVWGPHSSDQKQFLVINKSSTSDQTSSKSFINSPQQTRLVVSNL